jgi:hypothetical protein
MSRDLGKLLAVLLVGQLVIPCYALAAAIGECTSKTGKVIQTRARTVMTPAEKTPIQVKDVVSPARPASAAMTSTGNSAIQIGGNTRLEISQFLFKPLTDLDPMREQPQVIVFLADPDQLSALVVLTNYGGHNELNVIVPFVAGCRQIGIFPYREARSERPRAVIGLTDLSARKNLKKQLDRNVLSFAVPWRMFEEMEDNVEGSFLQKETWRALQAP